LNTSIFAYDAVGNIVASTDRNGYTCSYSYDALNRLIQKTDARSYSTFYAYDPEGNLTGETNALANTVSYGYDELNRLDSIILAGGGVYSFGHDATGNVTSFTDPLNNTHNFTYDNLDRLTQEQTAAGVTYSYTYDAMDNLFTRTDGNSMVTTYTHDAIHRLTDVSYSTGGSVAYQYDAVGNTTRMEHIGTTFDDITLWDYDNNNRLIEEVIDYGSFNKITSYDYDAAGNLTELTDPDGNTRYYTYDDCDRMTQSDDPQGGLTLFQYDGEGNTIQIDYPNGDVLYHSWDPDNNLETQSAEDAGSNPVFDYNYFYDALGNLSVVEMNGMITSQYDYDADNNLVHAFYDYGMAPVPYMHDIIYAYDAAGNRTFREDDDNLDGFPPSLTDYFYNADNRIDAFEYTPPSGPLEPVVYSYDGNGNVLLIENFLTGAFYQYSYDEENRLVVLDHLLTGGPLNFYDYAPDGNRYRLDETGTLTLEFPSLAGNVVEMDGSGTTVTSVNDGISHTTGSTTYFASYDAADNTTHFRDDLGNTVGELSMGYFGELLYPGGPMQDLDPGLYASDLKVDWDPLIGAELIGGDYAPDIDQHYGNIDLYSTQKGARTIHPEIDFLNTGIPLPSGGGGGGAGIIYPGTSSFGGIIMEDDFPSSGDNDFNDAFIAYNYVRLDHSPNFGSMFPTIGSLEISERSPYDLDPDVWVESFFDVSFKVPEDPDWWVESFFDVSFEWPSQSKSPAWLPVPSDYDGDGRTDIAIWKKPGDRWRILIDEPPLAIPGPLKWGETSGNDWIPVPGDFDGDGNVDLPVFGPGKGNLPSLGDDDLPPLYPPGPFFDPPPIYLPEDDDGDDDGPGLIMKWGDDDADNSGYGSDWEYDYGDGSGDYAGKENSDKSKKKKHPKKKDSTKKKKPGTKNNNKKDAKEEPMKKEAQNKTPGHKKSSKKKATQKK
jgi:YD repeat-containing protein